MTTTTILVVGVLICEAIRPGFWWEFTPWKALLVVFGLANIILDINREAKD